MEIGNEKHKGKYKNEKRERGREKVIKSLIRSKRGIGVREIM